MGENYRFTNYSLLRDKQTIVTTFLSLLELMKRQIIQVEQKSNFDDLFVHLRKEDIESEFEDEINE